MAKKLYMRIDEHTHVGQEVDGSLNVRNMLTAKSGSPAAWDNQGMVMRKYFVDAGRWDKKYLDMSLIPPLTLDDLVYHMDDAGIDKSIIIGRDYQCPWPPYTRVLVPAEYVANCVDKFPDRLVGIAPINPWEMNCATRIKYWVEDLHLKGVGEIYTPTGIHADDEERCYPIYEACQEYGIPIFIHCLGFIGGLVGRGWWKGRPLGDPRSLEAVGYDFPNLKVVIHRGAAVGGGDVVAQLVKNFPNFYTQVAYWARRLSEPGTKDWILWCQENIPDKVFFSTDYPWGFPQKECVQWVENMPELTEDFKKKIFETNVKKVYKI